MTAVRGFARYLAGIDADTEVPPLGLVPHRQRWRRPFIYSDSRHRRGDAPGPQTIASPLRAATYDTLIGLLAATGLRIGEAIKLDRNDIDWAEGVLLIRESKFGKSRLVPLHASSMQALTRLRHAARRAAAAARRSPASSCPSPRKRLIYAVVVPDVPAAGRHARHRRRCALAAAAARPAAHLRRPHPARLVSHRRGRPGQDPVAVDLSRTPRTGLHLLVSVRRPGTARAGRGPPGQPHRAGGPVMTLIAPTLQAFFTDRLARQRQASPRTIAAYRDTLRLLLGFVHNQTGKLPAAAGLGRPGRRR